MCVWCTGPKKFLLEMFLLVWCTGPKKFLLEMFLCVCVMYWPYNSFCWKCFCVCDVLALEKLLFEMFFFVCMWCSFQLVSVIITINQIFIYLFVIILHENPSSLVSKGVMFPNYWGWKIKDMIFFQELWGYVSGLLSSKVSLSPKSFAFRKLKFKSIRAVSWLIRAIQAVTNATGMSTSQPCRIRYFDQLPSLESSLSVEAQSNIVQIAGYVEYLQKDKRIAIGTTKSMTSLLQYSVVEVWLFMEKK